MKTLAPIGAAARLGPRAAAGSLALSLVLAGAFLGSALAQPVAPTNGPRRVDPGWHALVHAKLIPEPGKVIDDATIVFRDGVITSVEAKAPPPAGARVWDCSGLSVYPGLIDAYVPVDAPKPDASAPGTHWNPLVTPQRSALDGKGVDAESRKKLRAQGFTVAATAPKGGIFRGTAAVVSLGERPESSDPLAGVIIPKVYQSAALDTAGGRGRDAAPDAEAAYPGAKMGAIALMRQTLADVPWYAKAMSAYSASPTKADRPAPSDACVALAEPLPLVFDIDNELDDLRVAKIAKEFSRTAMLVCSGTEFRRIDAVVATGLPMIVPVAFAEKPKVETQADREAAGLRELMTWEAAPTNLKRLDAAGAKVAITSSKLPKGQEFFANLRAAIRAGLSEDRALAMMTTTPAELLGLGSRLGRVQPGMNADLVVVKGSLFDKKREVRDVWIDGRRHEVNAAPKVDLKGDWEASLGGPDGSVAGTLKVGEKNRTIRFERPVTDKDLAREKAEKEKAAKERAEKAKAAGKEPPADEAKPENAKGDADKGEKGDKKPSPTRTFKANAVNVIENRVDFTLDGEALGGEGSVSLSAIVEGDMIGTAQAGDAKPLSWSAKRKPADASKPESAKPDADSKDAKGADEEEPEPDKDEFTGIPEKFGLPFGPFAFDEPPAQPATLIVKNATIWTSGSAGTIKNAELVVSKGKVVSVGAPGAGKVPKDAVVIDAKGRHVTSGLIDCHSHTGISGGVNEGTQAVTAEVRIFDVIDPDAIGLYRELAGGLTVANQLHGSANPIGGQNSVVKLRWGAAHPDEMRFEGAPAGIKFALGENVKQSNWADSARTRYPQTRMGVETLMRDRFSAAREYGAEWKKWSGLSDSEKAKAVPPRRDLELEAMAEILTGERLVHCHSYRQDEILMLCRIAKDFGFKIGTFQHVLEGYKVAEAIKENAIGGSSFSDWWAYKFEVIDAIPYNGAIMHDVGIPVSFNSDSDELARRMNVEAGKAVKYGGLSPEEALKFVTLNPAKQLKIDARVGSLEAGKDADFVIWSGDPLSSLSRCEATYIDGREHFSLDRDRQMRDKVKSERQRIIQKVLKQSKNAGRTGGPGGRGDRPGGPGADPAPTFFFDLAHRGGGLVPVGPGDLDEIRRQAAGEAAERQYLWLITNGIDPYSSHPGDCGCGVQCLFLNN